MQAKRWHTHTKYCTIYTKMFKWKMRKRDDVVNIPTYAEACQEAKWHAVLSDPTRIQIWCMVRASGQISTGDIIEHCGISGRMASYHLGLMRTAGVIRARDKRNVGGRVCYEVVKKTA